jgi:hypothetical protein
MGNKKLEMVVLLGGPSQPDKIPDDNELSAMILKVMEQKPKDFKPGVADIMIGMILMFEIICSPDLINRLTNEHPLLSDFSI